ncbi:MAG: amino acid permease [Anaerovoracaceae bacterium]
MSSNDKEHDLEQQQLKREIKGWQISFIALGGVVGSVYFLGVALIINDMGPAVVIAYGIVGFILFGIMIAFAELIVNLPRRGAFIAYAHEFLGEPIAAGIGWSYWLAWGAFIPSEAIAGGFILNSFIEGPVMLYAGIILGLVTIINLAEVKFFARIESGLAITKVGVIVIFIIAAIGIWLGIWGTGDGFIGTKVLLDDTNANIFDNLFPGGIVAIFVGMTLIFSTVGGVEIVGMTAAEAEEPEKSVPKACRSIVYRVCLVYIIPVILIVLLFPTEEAGIDGSIFALVLSTYGLNKIAWIFTFVVIVAAFSCSNTAFYATARDMYGLAQSGLAPKIFKKVNKNQSPRNSVYVSTIYIWLIFIFAVFAGESTAYMYLITATGFAGAICWIGIIASQLRFRYLLKKRGYDVKSAVKSRIKIMAVPIAALILLLAGLGYLAAGLGSFGMFVIAILAFAVPFAIFVFKRTVLHSKTELEIPNDEEFFNDKYPPKKKI